MVSKATFHFPQGVCSFSSLELVLFLQPFGRYCSGRVQESRVSNLLCLALFNSLSSFVHMRLYFVLFVDCLGRPEVPSVLPSRPPFQGKKSYVLLPIFALPSWPMEKGEAAPACQACLFPLESPSPCSSFPSLRVSD